MICSADSGGWTKGLLAEGWDVVGFDIERHAYGDHRYPAQLVLQDVRTIDGAQFRDASLIVASSPCQEFSYRAMPWKRARELGPPLLGMELFAQAERIQREAIEASTCPACADWHITAYCDVCEGTRQRFIPVVQENVRGAQKWVGRARWHYGSYYLWGDVPALMPMVTRRAAMKVGEHDDSVKIGGSRGDDWFAHHNRPEFEDRATKNDGGSWFNVAHNTTSGKGQNPDGRKSTNGGSWFGEYTAAPDGVKQGGDWFDDPISISRRSSSKSAARKAASARIAKIPLPLARHIAKVYYPTQP